MHISEFLNESVEIEEAGVKVEILRIERIAELYTKNRFNFEVTGWGNFEHAENPAENPWGVWGLSLDEALELIRYESFILGCEFSDDSLESEAWYTKNIFNPLEAQIRKSRDEKIKQLQATFSGDNPEFTEELEKRLIVELNKFINETVDIDEMLEKGIRYVLPATLSLDEDQMKTYFKHGYITDVKGIKRFDLKKVKDNINKSGNGE